MNISKKMIKITLSILLFLLTAFSTYSAPAKTVYSIVSGASWVNSSHWSTTSGGSSCSCTPDISKDIIYVETNTSSASGLTFGASVTVTIRNNSIFTIIGNSQFNNGSTVVVNTGSQLTINGNLTNNNNSNLITIDGTLTINGDFTGGTGSAITGDGNMSTTGSATTSGTGTVFGFNNDCVTGPCSSNKNTPLPVDLVSYTVELKDGNAELSWLTSSEINNNRFVVEKSSNCIDFEILTKVNGAGNSNEIRKYKVTDIEISIGTSYYRLSQIDNDGAEKNLGIVAVSKISDVSACNLFVKPNPCIGKCEVSFENCTEAEFQNARFSIFDALGNAVYTSVSKQITNGRASFEIENSNYLKPSVYIIRGSVYNKSKATQMIINK